MPGPNLNSNANPKETKSVDKVRDKEASEVVIKGQLRHVF